MYKATFVNQPKYKKKYRMLWVGYGFYRFHRSHARFRVYFLQKFGKILNRFYRFYYQFLVSATVRSFSVEFLTDLPDEIFNDIYLLPDAGGVFLNRVGF